MRSFFPSIFLLLESKIDSLLVANSYICFNSSSFLSADYMCDDTRLTRTHYFANVLFADHNWQSGSQIIKFDIITLKVLISF